MIQYVNQMKAKHIIYMVIIILDSISEICLGEEILLFYVNWKCVATCVNTIFLVYYFMQVIAFYTIQK